VKGLGALLFVLAAVSPASAQTTATTTFPHPWAPGPTAPRIVFDVGAVLVGPAGAGKTSALYTAPDGSSVPQFTIDKSIGPAVGVRGNVSIRISSRVSLEATARWARPQFRTKLAGDTDGADDTTATQSVDQFVVGGGAKLALKSFGRWHTFARGTFGWLRELSDDLSLYQDGWAAEVGGGATFQWTEKKGRFRPYGIRTDIWLDLRHGGLSFAEKSRVMAPALAAAMIFKL
jgi:hypothetical protein